MTKHMRAFLTSDSGAVTVDWVVITGAVVGIGLAVLMVVASGLNDASNRTADFLASLGGSLSEFSELVLDTFDNGPGNWQGADVNDVVGFGNILGPIRGREGGAESVSQVVDIPEGAAEVLFTFDMLSMDSIDGGLVDRGWGANEGPVLYIDGQEVARARSTGGELHWTYHDVDGVAIDSTAVRTGDNIGGPAHTRQNWYDGINTVRVNVDDLNRDNVRIGIGFDADQGVRDESIGIDNFGVQFR